MAPRVSIAETDFTIVGDPFLILLPPSEGKAPGGDPDRAWTPDSGRFGPELADQRAHVVRSLKKISGGSEVLLGVRGAHLERARAANLALEGAPTLPAWRRYSGVVWDHLDLASMPSPRRRVAARRILVPSGLLGLSLGDDPIPDHRIKMGARLAPMGTLSKWWNEQVTAAVARVARGRAVVDLLPGEHRAAVGMLEGRVVVDLVARSGGRVGGHDAKSAKGLLARHLLDTDEQTIARAVASFRHRDYVARIMTGQNSPRGGRHGG